MTAKRAHHSQRKKPAPAPVHAARGRVVGVVIALVSTTALIAVAAWQKPATPPALDPPSRRAVINAAEERAIWKPAPATQSAVTPAVTIEGCLEQRGDSYRLKDTSGADAPKSRSWKSAFLKKGSAPIDLVVPARSTVASHVGEQVRVTGVLTDREMQVRSVRRVAESCT
jgi:hypothetical protein